MGEDRKWFRHRNLAIGGEAMKGMVVFLVVCTTVILASTLVACQREEPPSADAGADFSLKVGEQPTFDGCASAGDIVNYKWTIITCPEACAADEGKVIRETDPNCSFTLEATMVIEEVGLWTIELEVSDSEGNTSRDSVRVEVSP